MQEAVLVRACLDWSNPHCKSTNSEPGAHAASVVPRQEGPSCATGDPAAPGPHLPALRTAHSPAVPGHRVCPAFPMPQELCKTQRDSQGAGTRCPCPTPDTAVSPIPARLQAEQPHAGGRGRCPPPPLPFFSTRAAGSSAPPPAPAPGEAEGAAGTQRHFFHTIPATFPSPSLRHWEAQRLPLAQGSAGAGATEPQVPAPGGVLEPPPLEHSAPVLPPAPPFLAQSPRAQPRAPPEL